eukprot:NODE_10786_length_1329_cov_4.281198.p2 GENE.NODE_10786_length_1329_cov_4.281198~~NODE_10786_length_1329_cov_4.281198.p2  ORF type:complete len:301 (+),score=89.65 NODE_10786_length_1329_cov_4.281198:130-903(+)
MPYRFFVFGPSGSGDKLHHENGMPFYDVLIHGSRRWLLLDEAEMTRVATKAREALEFDKTSAYMFFEEKLPELKEEFGLKKFMECNQQAGDLIFVPPGWFRVSLALADSISYYQTLMGDSSILKAVTENHLWQPMVGNFNLAFCYKGELEKLPNIKPGSRTFQWMEQGVAHVGTTEHITNLLYALLACGPVLALDESLPEFRVKSLTPVCNADVWKQCRKQLVAKLEQKGVSVSLAWLPEEPPNSAAALPAPTKTEL